MVRYAVFVDEVPSLPCNGVFGLKMMSADSLYQHEWANINDFSTVELFQVGTYRAIATSGNPIAEGYDCQSYTGTEVFEIEGNIYTDVTINCHLAQAMVNVEISQSLLNAYPSAYVTLHSAGYGYVVYDPQALTPALLVPGSTYFYVTLADAAGKSVTVAPNITVNTKAANTYNVKVEYADNKLVVGCGDVQSELPITPQLFQSECPSIAASGFEMGQPITLTEGYPASSPVVMEVDAPAGLQSLILTSIGTPAAFDGFPQECDLLKPVQSLTAYGLNIYKESDSKCAVDFTKLLENLSVTANSEVVFMLQARDVLGRVSEASVLRVLINNVDFDLISQTPAEVGSNVASVTLAVNAPQVQVSDFAVYITDEYGNKKKSTPIINMETDSEHTQVTLYFSVGEGIADVPVLIEYMGNPKLYATIKRTVGEYKVAADAFALSAIISVQGADSAATASIVSMATVMSGNREMMVDLRSPTEGKIRVVGLEPSTTYVFTLKLTNGGYEPQLVVATESATQLPDPDFEDVDELFKYNRLPSGGVYSASAFPVFNMQNFTDIRVMWMQKSWTSVNDKTFCRSASNHNTWYMQPSANMDYASYKSGTKSVVISSVGWSLKGEEIAPYVQEPGQYLHYNANVPAPDHVSAGRLFLGGYTFDPSTCQEKYKDGIGFGSRPSSLNGFYKYLPEATGAGTDYGWVEVQLISEITTPPTVIAKSSMRLAPSPDFVSFNLPITYDVLNMKATRIKVMFASSWRCGTIAEEDLNVPVSPDAETATFSGSKLWIDNLSLSYAF